MSCKNKYYTNIYDYFVEKKVDCENQFENIYAKLKVGTTYKTTAKNRMDKLNEVSENVLSNNLNATDKLKICDFGISSGDTTLDLIYALNEKNFSFEIIGFDKNIEATMITLGKFIFLFSSDNRLLFVEYNKYAVKKKIVKFFSIFEKTLFKFLNYSKYTEKKKIDLLSNDLRNSNNFKFEEQDIFKINEYLSQFDFIRVSNLLNFSYFSDEQINLACKNIFKILKNGGILLVNRTSGTEENGSFFIKDEKEFKLIQDFGKGSETKNIVLSTNNCFENRQ